MQAHSEADVVRKGFEAAGRDQPPDQCLLAIGIRGKLRRDVSHAEMFEGRPSALVERTYRDVRLVERGREQHRVDDAHEGLAASLLMRRGDEQTVNVEYSAAVDHCLA